MGLRVTQKETESQRNLVAERQRDTEADTHRDERVPCKWII